MKTNKSTTSIIDAIKKSDTARVKVAVADIDGVLRGKYIHKDKFFSAIDGGFGFYNVVLGWDSNDVTYDNAKFTGWHTGFPDAMVKLDLATHRNIQWDDNASFFFGDFVDGNGDLCGKNLKLSDAPIQGENRGAENIECLPRTLEKATAVFKHSKFARAFFGDAFVDHFAATREREWHQFQDAVTDWEFRRYFEII